MTARSDLALMTKRELVDRVLEVEALFTAHASELAAIATQHDELRRVLDDPKSYEYEGLSWNAIDDVRELFGWPEPKGAWLAGGGMSSMEVAPADTLPGAEGWTKARGIRDIALAHEASAAPAQDLRWLGGRYA